MADSFQERIGFDGDITEVVGRGVADYQLGEILEQQLIESGFQDHNRYVKTTKGEYLLKIFSNSRDEANAKRYVEIIEAVIDAGVNHPPLFKDSLGEGMHTDPESGLRMAVLGYIKGKTFYDMNRPPNSAELDLITAQAVKINAAEFEPSYLFDSWAVPNLRWMFDQVKAHLDEEGLQLGTEALRRYEAVPVDKLPKCFVHGDIIQTNAVLDETGKVYIIDFACSNIYPRIQELAVMAANLMSDGSTTLRDRADQVLESYLRSGGQPLNEIEQASLFGFVIAAAAMEFLGGHFEKYVNHDESDEAVHWIEVGRQSLKSALEV